MGVSTSCVSPIGLSIGIDRGRKFRQLFVGWDFLWYAICSLLPRACCIVKQGKGGTIQLENYFDFHTPTDVRLNGTRVGIETILLDYLDLGLSPEEIALRYPVLTLEQVFATLTYYWRYQPQVDDSLKAWKAHGEQQRRLQAAKPSAILARLQTRSQQVHQQTAIHTALPV